ncbi:MAG: TldD/PmbA family protein [Actinomycetota bacterium]
MADSLEKVIKKTAGKISRSQADEYEIFGISSTETEIEVYEGEIESLSLSDSRGIGIRVIKEGAVGYAFTSSLGERDISECIDKAVTNAKVTSREDLNLLPKPEDYLYKDKPIEGNHLYDEQFSRYSVEDKGDAAKELESITLGKDKRITGVNNLSYHDMDVGINLFNSIGFNDGYRKSSCFMYVNAISKEKEDTSTGDYFGFGRHLGEINPEEIAENAARRSVSLLGAKKIKSKKVDILLDPMVGAQFMGVVADALTADAVQKGKSLFKGMRGEKLISTDLDIFDDGIMPGGLATAPFDGEGVYKGKTAVFKNGILDTFLYNTYTARKDGTKSTGNASRFSYRSVPSVGINNFYISPGKKSFRELVSSIDEGFFVIDIIGLHSGANSITGDISVGAKGIWIENGDLSFPVKEVTIATDFSSFLNNITDVGDSLRFIPSGGFIGSPALLVREVMVSGV